MERPSRHVAGATDSFLTTGEVGERLGIPRKTVYVLIHQHGLPAHRFGKHLQVSEADLRAWTESQRLGTTSSVTPLPRRRRV